MSAAPEAAATAVPVIETARLILRPWREDDRPGFAAMNGDPEVRRFFPSVMTPDEAGALLDRLLDTQRREIVFAAVEEKRGGLVGMAGLAVVGAELPPGPAVEIGWRLARNAWGRGYATEAARGWLTHGFGAMGLGEIVSFAVAGNARSRAVMERLGMRRDAAGDFDHPALPVDSPLRAHVLYRLKREEWRA